MSRRYRRGPSENSEDWTASYYPHFINTIRRESPYQAYIHPNLHVAATKRPIMSLVPPWVTREPPAYSSTDLRDEDAREPIAEARRRAEIRTDGEGEDTMNDQYDECLRERDHSANENNAEQPLTAATNAPPREGRAYDEQAASSSAHAPSFPSKMCSSSTESRSPHPASRRRSPYRSRTRSLNSRSDSERSGRLRNGPSIEDMMKDLNYEMKKLRSEMHKQMRSLRSLRNLQRDNQALVDELSRDRELSDYGKDRQARSEHSSRH
jgi:hypothetical protein